MVGAQLATTRGLQGNMAHNPEIVSRLYQGATHIIVAMFVLPKLCATKVVTCFLDHKGQGHNMA